MVGVSIRQRGGQQTGQLPEPARATHPGFEPAPWRDPLWHRARHLLWQATDLHAALAAEAAAWQGPAEVRTLLACAEFHGMVPLLAHHLRSVAPPPLRRLLGAVQARNRRITAARQQAIAALVEGCAERGLPLLLLKGAALANTVYPDPTLRPMRDVDVLIEPAHAAAMLELLRSQGFAPAGDRPPAGHHHLPGMVRLCHGVPVHVEVHTRLGLSRRFALHNGDLFAQAVPCPVGGAIGRMPSPGHMLWHVAHHGFAMPFTTEASKLIWYADLRALVEAWWEVPGFARGPTMRSLLEQLAATRPWPAGVGAPGAETASLVSHAAEQPRASGSTGARQRRPMLAPLDYAGWPRASLSEGAGAQRRQAWRATLLPPRFWLGMRHRVRPRPLPLLGAWLLHLRDLLQKAWGLRVRGS